MDAKAQRAVLRAAVQRATLHLRDLEFSSAAAEAQDVLKTEKDNFWGLLLLGTAWTRMLSTGDRSSPDRGHITRVLAKAIPGSLETPAEKKAGVQVFRALAELHSVPDEKSVLLEDFKLAADLARLRTLYRELGDVPKALEYALRLARECGRLATMKGLTSATLENRSGRDGSASAAADESGDSRLNVYANAELAWPSLGLEAWEAVLDEVSVASSSSETEHLLATALSTSEVPLQDFGAGGGGASVGVAANDSWLLDGLYAEALRSRVEIARAWLARVGPASKLDEVLVDVVDSVLCTVDTARLRNRVRSLSLESFGGFVSLYIERLMFRRQESSQSTQDVWKWTEELLGLCHAVVLLGRETKAASAAARTASRTIDVEAATQLTCSQQAICHALKVLCILYDEEAVDQARSRSVDGKRSLALQFIAEREVVSFLAAQLSGTRHPDAHFVYAWDQAVNVLAADSSATEQRKFEIIGIFNQSVSGCTRYNSGTAFELFPPFSAQLQHRKLLLECHQFELCFELSQSSNEAAWAREPRVRASTLSALIETTALALINVKHSSKAQHSDVAILNFFQKVLSLYATSGQLRTRLLTLAAVTLYETEVRTDTVPMLSAILDELEQNSDRQVALWARCFMFWRNNRNVEELLLVSLMDGAAFEGSSEPLLSAARLLYTDARQALAQSGSLSQENMSFAAGIASLAVALWSIAADDSREDVRETFILRALTFLRGKVDDDADGEASTFSGLSSLDSENWEPDMYVTSQSLRHRRLRRHFLSKAFYLKFSQAAVKDESGSEWQNIELLIKAGLYAPSTLCGKFALVNLTQRLSRNNVATRHKKSFAALLQKLASKFSSDSFIWYHLGHFVHRNFRKATEMRESTILAFQNVLRFSPEISVAGTDDGKLITLSWLGLAECYSDQGKYTAAAKCFTQLRRALQTKRELDVVFDSGFAAYCTLMQAELYFVRRKVSKAVARCAEVVQLTGRAGKLSNGCALLMAPAYLIMGSFLSCFIFVFFCIFNALAGTLRFHYWLSSSRFTRSALTRRVGKSQCLRALEFLGSSPQENAADSRQSFVVSAVCGAVDAFNFSRRETVLSAPNDLSLQLEVLRGLTQAMALTTFLNDANCREVLKVAGTIEDQDPAVPASHACLLVGLRYADELCTACTDLSARIVCDVHTLTAILFLLHSCTAKLRKSVSLALKQLNYALKAIQRAGADESYDDAITRIHSIAAHAHMVLAALDPELDTQHMLDARHHAVVAVQAGRIDTQHFVPPFAKNTLDLICLERCDYLAICNTEDWTVRSLLLDVCVSMFSPCTENNRGIMDLRFSASHAAHLALRFEPAAVHEIFACAALRRLDGIGNPLQLERDLVSAASAFESVVHPICEQRLLRALIRHSASLPAFSEFVPDVDKTTTDDTRSLVDQYNALLAQEHQEVDVNLPLDVLRDRVHLTPWDSASWLGLVACIGKSSNDTVALKTSVNALVLSQENAPESVADRRMSSSLFACKQLMAAEALLHVEDFPTTNTSFDAAQAYIRLLPEGSGTELLDDALYILALSAFREAIAFPRQQFLIRRALAALEAVKSAVDTEHAHQHRQAQVAGLLILQSELHLMLSSADHSASSVRLSLHLLCRSATLLLSNSSAIGILNLAESEDVFEVSSTLRDLTQTVTGDLSALLMRQLARMMSHAATNFAGSLQYGDFLREAVVRSPGCVACVLDLSEYLHQLSKYDEAIKVVLECMAVVKPATPIFAALEAALLFLKFASGVLVQRSEVPEHAHVGSSLLAAMANLRAGEIRAAGARPAQVRKMQELRETLLDTCSVIDRLEIQRFSTSTPLRRNVSSGRFLSWALLIRSRARELLGLEGGLVDLRRCVQVCRDFLSSQDEPDRLTVQAEELACEQLHRLALSGTFSEADLGGTATDWLDAKRDAGSRVTSATITKH